MPSRRSTLRLLSAAFPALAPLSAISSSAFATEAVESAAFLHGVASGDPTSHSVVLWTRLSGASGVSALRWQLAYDPNFENLVTEGDVTTGPQRDYTAKVEVTGLEPGQRWYYRFLFNNAPSPTGTTRTLPVYSVKQLRLALVSCSNYSFGYFNAYAAIASDKTLDGVLHTGDYLYEYGADEWGADQGKKLGRSHYPPHEIVSLQDYRQRHAQYKSDAGSRAMHAAHPLFLVWDDHESANNPWTGGAQNHQPQTEGAWLSRRQAALQAWYEWMPVREPAPGTALEDYWRQYVFGDLATLICTETRHTARAGQIDYAAHRSSIIDSPSRDRFLDEILGAANRPMIGEKQERFIQESLKKSVASKQPWRLLGNAVPMARMHLPDLAHLPFVTARAAESGIDELLWKSKWHLPWYTDTWDGYPAAREAFYQLCTAAGVHDLVVLTGDSHSFWFNTLADGNGRHAGVELGTAGVTSPGDFLDQGFSLAQAEQLDRVLEQGMDEVLWTDGVHNGFVVIDITHERIEAMCIAVDTVEAPRAATFELKRARITRHAGVLHMDVQ